MIKLALSDVDGTLVPLAKGHPSARTMAAIQELQGAGVRFGVCTGRDVMELNAIFGGNDAAYRTGILSNGKKIMVDGQLVRLTLLDNDALQRMAEVVAEFPGSFLTAYPLNTDQTNPVYCVGATEDEVASFARVYAFAGSVVSRVPGEEIIGATIACPHDQRVMDDIKARGARVCPEFDFVQPAPHWCDILPKGLNKGTAFQLLLGELGIANEEVVVFGDADNDLAVLCTAENSVAVAGATPAAKAASRWHIGACEDDAVALALSSIARSVRDGGVPAFMRERQ